MKVKSCTTPSLSPSKSQAHQLALTNNCLKLQLRSRKMSKVESTLTTQQVKMLTSTTSLRFSNTLRMLPKSPFSRETTIRLHNNQAWSSQCSSSTHRKLTYLEPRAHREWKRTTLTRMLVRQSFHLMKTLKWQVDLEFQRIPHAWAKKFEMVLNNPLGMSWTKTWLELSVKIQPAPKQVFFRTRSRRMTRDMRLIRGQV